MEADYDSDAWPQLLGKKKARTGVLLACKHNSKSKNPKHGYIQRYCVICKKYGMLERKYKLHSSETCFGKRSGQISLNKGLGGILGNRNSTVK